MKWNEWNAGEQQVMLLYRGSELLVIYTFVQVKRIRELYSEIEEHMKCTFEQVKWLFTQVKWCFEEVKMTEQNLTVNDYEYN